MSTPEETSREGQSKGGTNRWKDTQPADRIEAMKEVAKAGWSGEAGEKRRKALSEKLKNK
jgi:hypothetical protein